LTILFHVRNPKNAIRFEPLFQVWAERGEEVRLLLDPAPREHTLTAELARTHPRFDYGEPPAVESNGSRARLSGGLRSAVDFLFFQEPEFAGASSVLDRAAATTAPTVRRLAGAPLIATSRGRSAVRRALQAAERRLPSRPEIEAFIAGERPDLFLVSPLLVAKSDRKGLSQLDYLRAAKRLGIPTGLLVASWDNLTTKGLIQEFPDFMTVWNEAMKREAVELHGMPAERVLVTGAPNFDDLFAWQPDRSREQFLAEVGLDPKRPYLLYMCSSRFVTHHAEVDFVRQWLSAIRASSNEEVSKAQVLVRPYPGYRDDWGEIDGGSSDGVAVWPLLSSGKALDPGALSDLRHSIHHSAAVIGANTSALIESAVIGRAVYSILSPSLARAQEGTVHFRLISEFAGGLLNVSRSFDEHAAQLARALRGEDEAAQAERRRAFLKAFVRPLGLDRPAAPALADAIAKAIS
jgi:hypothetical protein